MTSCRTQTCKRTVKTSTSQFAFSPNASVRIAATLTAIVVCAALGLLQATASIVLRSRAVPGSWVMAVPGTVVAQMERLPPNVPVDGALRVALAREALAHGDLVTARRQISALESSPDRLALQAQLALRDGDWETALRDALASEDLTTIDGLTRALLATGDVGQALAVQKAAVAQLVADPTQGEALAEAEFRLGHLEEMTAWHLYVGTRVRRRHELAALAAYTRASALAPFAVRYLVALGTQAITVDRYALADAVFTRARTVDPTSAEPEVGLAELALRRGDRTAASVALARAQALEPRSAAVRRLAQMLAQ